jgi:cation diffusion facilitator family transporter
MKFIVGSVSGSVSIISEAIHSMMDLLASVIAFFSVRVSDNPPDKEHPYGHGKVENISGVIEAILILVAAVWIIIEAVEKFMHPSDVVAIGWAAAVMLTSGIVNMFVSRQLYRVAKKTDSIALEADALHLKTDVLTSFGVGLALLLMYFTNWKILDPLFAIVVACLIVRESYNLLRNAFLPLIDQTLDDKETGLIYSEMDTMKLKFHSLRTRKSGRYRFVDMHLELPSATSLGDIHSICDKVEENLKSVIPYLDVNIHVEPNDHVEVKMK